MAIVVSKDPLDYNRLISSINSKSGSFDDRIQQALGGAMNHNTQYSGRGQIDLNADASGGTATYAVLEIEKR
jgi:hypothetical protein